MKNKKDKNTEKDKLNLLVKEIRRQYLEAQGDYQMSSMLGSGGPLGRMEASRSLIEKVNQIYGTIHYLPKENDAPDFHTSMFDIYTHRWAELWGDLDAKVSLEKEYFSLKEAYAQPHRHYHTFEHIQAGLQDFDQAKHLMNHPLAVELAWWYHDYAYELSAKDNEERSAQEAGKIMQKARLPRKMAGEVEGLILATKHQEKPATLDQQFIQDIDLAIFGREVDKVVYGQPIDHFQKYELDIRAEYAQVPRELYCQKRAKLLQKFLSRERIYSTDFFHSRYEERARQNLERLIKRLEK